jgi:hypothetical protein
LISFLTSGAFASHLALNSSPNAAASCPIAVKKLIKKEYVEKVAILKEY